MSTPNPKRQKAALALLDRTFEDAANVWVIHYSCESFYDRPKGHSPRITSIAVRRLDSGQTTSFSIHQIAECHRVTGISTQYDDLEKNMLDEFFSHISTHRGMKYLHWNMRNIKYGFAAIEHRYQVLNGEPFIIEDSKKIDLASLLIDVYGDEYVEHPRLEKLMIKNHLSPLNFTNGAAEAAAFESEDYVALHQSTLCKVDVIASIAGRTHDRTLKTNTTWWQMHGGRMRSIFVWIAENQIFQAVVGLAGIISVVLAVWALW